MIELTNIKTTDKFKLLRRQINTMQNEIMANQPFVGALVNPSINYYSTDGKNSTLFATSAASTVKSSLTALCFPESDGVFVAGVWGMIQITEEPQFVGPQLDNQTDVVSVISVPAIHMATMPTNISTFISCDQLGLPSVEQIPGVTTKPMQTNLTDIKVVSIDVFDMYTPSIEQGDNICNIIISSPVK